MTDALKQFKEMSNLNKCQRQAQLLTVLTFNQ